jgi:hypothetical protein
MLNEGSKVPSQLRLGMESNFGPLEHSQANQLAMPLMCSAVLLFRSTTDIPSTIPIPNLYLATVLVHDLNNGLFSEFSRWKIARAAPFVNRVSCLGRTRCYPALLGLSCSVGSTDLYAIRQNDNNAPLRFPGWYGLSFSFPTMPSRCCSRTAV